MAKNPKTPDLSYIAEPLRPFAVPIGQVKANPDNTRDHDARSVDAIKKSLATFGQRAPLAVQRRTNTVYAGNGRLAAAKALGWTHIAVLPFDDDDEKARAFAIADNRVAELSDWNDARLAEQVAAFTEGSAWIDALGFTQAEIDRMLKGDEPNPEDTGVGPVVYKVIVECKGERDQAKLVKDLEQRGYKCQLLTS